MGQSVPGERAIVAEGRPTWVSCCHWAGEGLTAPDRQLLRPEAASPGYSPYYSLSICLLTCEMGLVDVWSLHGPCRLRLREAAVAWLQPPQLLASKTPSREVLGTETLKSWGGRPLKTLSEACSFRLCNWFDEVTLCAWTLRPGLPSKHSPRVQVLFAASVN